MTTTANKETLDRVYEFAVGDEDARVCRDVPESACRHLPRNFFAHLFSLVATKTGDRLAGPKLVLAWMLSTIGAPAFMVSLLVPIRESLALIPQLFVAALIRRAPVRKWFWVAGSIVQGISVAAMGVAAARLEPVTAGWSVIGLLVVFSLARGVCSVSSKDVMGKTVSKNRRGTLSGYAASAAGAATVGTAAVIALVVGDSDPGAVFFTVLLAVAGLLWLAAAATYSLIVEAPGATEGGGNAATEALGSVSLLWQDADFRHFVITRALLISTALSAPFLVVLANRHGEGSLSGLASLLVANGIAALISAPAWGRLADRSSRLVLILAAGSAAVLGVGVYLFAAAGSPWQPLWVYTAAFFLLAVIHTGVRVGRKTYLVDMANSDNRAAYVAVSNTVIGLLLLSGSAVGVVAAKFGVEFAVLVLAALAGLGALSALRLKEVQ